MRLPTLECLRALALVAACACGMPGRLPADRPPDEASGRRALFEYDSKADFALHENGPKTEGGAIVHDVTFRAAPTDPESTAAYLVKPAGGATRAAILWVHWLGNPATTNRTEFLAEAVSLADHGVVSLLVDAHWAKPNWYRNRVLENDRAESIAQVIALRRSLDLVQQQAGAGVPLAIVGHDYGAMYSAITSGVDPRARTCVYIACTASLVDWAFYSRKPADMNAYLTQIRPLELSDYLAANRTSSVLCQFAERDEYVPLTRAQTFFAASPAAKQMIVYGGADHSMSKPAGIREDRTRWLLRELGLH